MFKRQLEKMVPPAATFAVILVVGMPAAMRRNWRAVIAPES